MSRTQKSISIELLKYCVFWSEKGSMMRAMSSTDLYDIDHLVRKMFQNQSHNIENIVASVVDDMIHMNESQRRDRLAILPSHFFWLRGYI
jgi:anaerobic ribonucleoside-triphosphate reductase